MKLQDGPEWRRREGVGLLAWHGALLSSLLALASPLEARERPRAAGEILHGIERLGRTARVLYVAAHPDDENTRLLAWLVGERGVDAAYLSITRGGGGQNLVGTEQSEMLGLLRTLELLEAREIDGARQFFTRARDFGYSKSTEESLRLWGRERTLGDVVRVIRRFQPDVIVTRFAEDGGGHGHHGASATLTAQAFEAAADPARFPETGPPWKALRLVRNVSTWRLPADADLSAYLSADVGGYAPLIGRSWGEIAAASRTMHASQGFGTAPQRGPIVEYFEHLSGSAASRDLLDGVAMGEGAARLGRLLERTAADFAPAAPHSSLESLAEARQLLAALPPSPRRDDQVAALEALLRGAAGLWLSARAAAPAVVRGGEVDIVLSALNRSPADVRLHAVHLPGGRLLELDRALGRHEPFETDASLEVPQAAALALPHWLRGTVEPTFYGADDPEWIGMPDTESSLPVVFELSVAGVRMKVARELVHAVTDRVRGEVVRRVEVLPPVTVSAVSEVLLFPNREPATLRAVLRASAAAASGRLKIELPEGWRSEPEELAFELAEAGAERDVALKILPPRGPGRRAGGTAADSTAAGEARLVVETEGPSGQERHSFRLDALEHPHVPARSVLRPSIVRLVPLELAGSRRTVAYVAGSGDLVAESLRLVGHEVVELGAEALTSEDLSRFDAVVFGIRAYNVHPRLRHAREALDAYAARGGLVLVQYNTHSSNRALDAALGPYPMQLGRGRVTDETAPMSAIDERHPVLTTPNRLGAADFEGWIQERGLYFADSWDPRYEPIFRAGDPGEEPLEGSLLVAPVGEGAYVYTGLAFFRQLPAGVPGAHRLFANLLAYEPGVGGT